MLRSHFVMLRGFVTVIINTRDYTAPMPCMTLSFA